MLAMVCRSARCNTGDRSSRLELRDAVTLEIELLWAPSCADPTDRCRGSGYWAASNRPGLACHSYTPFIFYPRATPRVIVSLAIGPGICETAFPCHFPQHPRRWKEDGKPDQG